jgi:hypothetical protein
MVHEQIELYESLGATSESAKETLDIYQRLKRTTFDHVTITHITTEYLVSDLEGLATSADLVYEYASKNDYREFCLIDIKTTSKLDMIYLQWQLSIEAYLFEMQNPGCKVVDLCAMWLPKPNYGQPKAVSVDRVPNAEIERLIKADKEGEEFIPESTYDTFQFESQYIDLDRLIELRNQRDAINMELQDMLAQIKYEMDEGKRYSLRHTSSKTLQTITISNKQDTTRTGIDANLLKEQYPDIYNKVAKTSTVKGSVSIKLL